MANVKELQCDLPITVATYFVYAIPTIVVSLCSRKLHFRKFVAYLSVSILFTAIAAQLGRQDTWLDIPTKLANLFGTKHKGEHPYGNGCKINWSFEGMVVCLEWKYEGVCVDTCTNENTTVYKYSKGGTTEHCVRNLLNKVHKDTVPNYGNSKEELKSALGTATTIGKTQPPQATFGHLLYHDGGCVMNWSYKKMWIYRDWKYMAVCTDLCTNEAWTDIQNNATLAVEHCLKILLCKVFQTAESECISSVPGI